MKEDTPHVVTMSSMAVLFGWWRNIGSPDIMMMFLDVRVMAESVGWCDGRMEVGWETFVQVSSRGIRVSISLNRERGPSRMPPGCKGWFIVRQRP